MTLRALRVLGTSSQPRRNSAIHIQRSFTMAITVPTDPASRSVNCPRDPLQDRCESVTHHHQLTIHNSNNQRALEQQHTSSIMSGLEIIAPLVWSTMPFAVVYLSDALQEEEEQAEQPKTPPPRSSPPASPTSSRRRKAALRTARLDE